MIRRRTLASLYNQAAQRVHYSRHKLDIIHIWTDRVERFLDQHPWEAHRHEMQFLTLGFTTDCRVFSSRSELWACLEDGWYHREDLQELRALNRETAQDFNFDDWKACHRHFLPGFHIYSRKNLTCCADLASYVAHMQQDLECHYSGKNGRMYVREYTQKMRAWVEPYAQHIWQESRVFALVQELCRQAQRLPATELPELEKREVIVAGVLEQFPEIAQLDPRAREARLRHIHVLAREACEGTTR